MTSTAKYYRVWVGIYKTDTIAKSQEGNNEITFINENNEVMHGELSKFEHEVLKEANEVDAEIFTDKLIDDKLFDDKIHEGLREGKSDNSIIRECMKWLLVLASDKAVYMTDYKEDEIKISFENAIDAAKVKIDIRRGDF